MVQWKNECELLDRLFEIFCDLTSEGKVKLPGIDADSELHVQPGLAQAPNVTRRHACRYVLLRVPLCVPLRAVMRAVTCAVTRAVSRAVTCCSYLQLGLAQALGPDPRAAP